jgi:hypothetical protein
VNIQEFQAKRRGATLKERSAAQSHSNDLGRARGALTIEVLEGFVAALERALSRQAVAV